MNEDISVLIVDDSEDLRELLSVVIERNSEHWQVVATAAEGQQGIEEARTSQPDLVLLDIAMPVMDGVQATKQIRKQWPTACVLMLTGSNSRTDVDRAREAGAAGYVTKERIAAELIDAILEIGGR